MLLNLLGGVALLLWGMRMVEIGVSQAFGAGLRRWIGRGVGNPLLALLVGLGVTGLLQSSTATSLITASFVRQGLVSTGPALAVMLGADVGTAVVVQVLSLNLGWLSPLLILVGVIGFKTSPAATRQHVSRAIIGLGVILLSLRLLVAASEPLRSGGGLDAILDVIGGEPLLLVALGALATWVAHSSLAVVLLIGSQAAGGGMPMEVAFALVLGANLGGGVPQLTATLSSPPEVRRVPLGNLLFKLCGVLVGMALLEQAATWFDVLQEPLERQVAHFHLAFNLCLAAAFILFTAPMAKLLERLLPDAVSADDPGEPRYLDRAAIESPALALAHAERETLRLGDTVERMLVRTIDVLRDNDERLLQDIVRQDDNVDALHQAIKFYLMDLTREPMNGKESRRAQEVLAFTINLEQIGDIIDKGLMELAGKKARFKLAFSEEGQMDIVRLHKRLLDNFRLATAVFMSGEVEMARRLLMEKATFRQMERNAAEQHMARLRRNRLESIDTSSIHLDVLIEFKRINSHLMSVAYPILEQAGELFTSRLKPTS